MSNSVTINLGSGNLEIGFPRVTAQIWTVDAALPEQYIGSLPADLGLAELYRSWQIYYQSLCDRRQLKTRDLSGETDEFIICEEGITNVSESSFEELCFQFEQSINAWLKSKSFLNIERQMRSQLGLSEEIRVIIETNDNLLRRFPWHCWEFFRDYSLAEVAFSRPEYKRLEALPQTQNTSQSVRILAILGDNTGIDLEAEHQFLREIEDADVQFLVKPSREVFNLQLWDETGWDMLFFAGHSQTEDETGHLFLNNEESNNSLTIKQLEEAIKAAIERGLKLAIFNSCEGMSLGLALERLSLPVGIVMREPVPNRVAQDFFKFFLDAFANNRQSLTLSVQHARRKLQGLENEFPGASWLPAICLNPTLAPPTWVEMGGLLSCPYKGLFAFQEKDSHLFFGRDSFIQTLVDAVKTKSLVAIIGASGSGKSSVAFAGLVPELRTTSPVWHPIIIPFRPENRPFTELAAALVNATEKNTLPPALFNQKTHQLETDLRQNPDAVHQSLAETIAEKPGSHIVLIADQFEELYTLCPETEYQQFLDTVLSAIHQHPNITLVLTLRADFYGDMISYRPFSDAIQDNAYNLGPMNREELKQAIEAPAAYMQASIEPGLTDALIEAVWDQPSNLPLLEFTLTELWTKRKAGCLTHEAYETLGGVSSALANHAETVYTLLSDEDSLRAKQVFMQLVQPSESNLPTKRLATREEVKSNNWDLVKHLADQRLVVTNINESTGQETVEIIHEALIERWHRLTQWIGEEGEFRHWQERLRIAVQQWEESEHDDSALWRGKLLTEADYWRNQKWDELSGRDQDFLEQSTSLKNLNVENSDRRRRITITSLAGAVLVSMGLSGLAWWQGQRSIIREAEVLSQSSNFMSASDQDFDALMMSLKAKKKLTQVFLADQKAQTSVGAALKKAIYGINERNRLEGHEGKVNTVSFSPDGQTLASASEDKTIKLWRMDGTLLRTLEGHQGSVHSISFSPDGQMLASGGADNRVILWDMEGTLLKSLEGHRQPIRNVKFSPDGQTLASASDDKSIKLWYKDGTLLKTFTGHTDVVRGVDFSPDGQTLVTSSEDKTIKIWKKEGKTPKTISGYNRSVLSVAISPDGQVIAATSEDGTLRFWSLEGKLLKNVLAENTMHQVIFSHDGQVLVSADGDSTVRIWGRDGTLLKSFEGHEGAVFGVAYSPNGQIASASEDRTIKLWSLNNGLSTTIQGHRGDVLRAIFSPNDQIIATTSADHKIKLWSSNGRLLKTLKGHQNTVYGLSFSPDGQRIASGSWDKTVKLWTLEGKLLQTMRGHTDKVYAVSYHPNGQSIASASGDGTVKLWKQDGSLIRTLKGHDDAVHGVQFSPDGQMLASASHDQTAKLWRLDGTLLQTLEGHENWVHDVSFSPDSRTIATASHDKTIKLWNLQGELKNTFRGHDDRVLGVAFNPSGNLVASSSRDRTIKLWRFNGQEVTTFRSHRDWVHGVDFSHNGQTLASSSYDNTAVLWDLKHLNKPKQLLQQGCAWIQDYLSSNPQLNAEERSLCDSIHRVKNEAP